MAKELRAIEFTPINEPRTLDPFKPLIGDERALVRAALILGAVLMVWRLYVACIANVIWEESHFVVSGQHMALAYPDIPGGFAWLARLITSIFGWHVLPLRIVSLLIATAIPYGVWFMATPVVSRRNAVWAAIVAMLLPTATMNGTIYYPEGALQLLLALMMGCLLRALQTPDEAKGLAAYKWWLWTGAAAFAGLLIHYRFLVPGIATIVYLLASPEGRKQWRHPGIYIVAVIGALGMVPAILYNAGHDWPAIQFHVVNRVKIDPNPKHIISFLETQIGITTPVFFVALCGAGKMAFTTERHKPGVLLGYQSAIIFLFYCLQAIVNKKVMPHWPFMAYIPLLAYVPGALIGFADAATTITRRRVRLSLIATGPILALILGVLVTSYQWMYVHSAEIRYGARQANVLKNENWTLVNPGLADADARAHQRFGANVVWAASGHISAVHMEFPGVGKPRDLYTLDEPYDVLTSRFVVARADWKLDRAALMRDHAGQGVVLALNEPSYLFHDPEQVKFSEALCRSFDDIEPFRIVTLPPGKTAIDLFTARVRATPLAAVPNAPCPLVPSLYIAHPTRGQFVSVRDHGNYHGIAADPKGVTKVDVLIDHKFAAPTRFGLNPAEFHTPQMLSWAPGWPNIQYDYHFPEGSLKPGQHILTIQATHPDGTTAESDPRILYVTKTKGLPSYFEGKPVKSNK